MRVINYPSISFSIDKDEDGNVTLSLAEMIQIVPGTQPVVTTVHTVIFIPEKWENFKRHVNADGDVPAIEIAKIVPGGPNGGA